jgi:hypothetical protein
LGPGVASDGDRPRSRRMAAATGVLRGEGLCLRRRRARGGAPVRPAPVGSRPVLGRGPAADRRAAAARQRLEGVRRLGARSVSDLPRARPADRRRDRRAFGARRIRPGGAARDPDRPARRPVERAARGAGLRRDGGARHVPRADRHRPQRAGLSPLHPRDPFVRDAVRSRAVPARESDGAERRATTRRLLFTLLQGAAEIIYCHQRSDEQGLRSLPCSCRPATPSASRRGRRCGSSRRSSGCSPARGLLRTGGGDARPRWDGTSRCWSGGRVPPRAREARAADPVRRRGRRGRVLVVRRLLRPLALGPRAAGGVSLPVLRRPHARPGGARRARGRVDADVDRDGPRLPRHPGAVPSRDLEIEGQARRPRPPARRGIRTVREDEVDPLPGALGGREGEDREGAPRVRGRGRLLGVPSDGFRSS